MLVGTAKDQILIYKNYVLDEKSKLKGHKGAIINLHKSNLMGLFFSAGEDKKIICWNFSTME